MTFLGWISDPFQWLSDLQLGYEKVTLNHLEMVNSREFQHLHFAPPPPTKPIRLTISTPTTFKVQLRRGVFAFKTWTGREEEDSATTTWICLRGFFYGFYHMLNHHCYTVTFGRICSFFFGSKHLIMQI